MATEHNSEHALLQQAIQHSFGEGRSPSGLNNRRFGVFFPTGVGLPSPPIRNPTTAHTGERPEEATTVGSSFTGSVSSWEFHAPQPTHTSRRHSTASYGTKKSTPAQELASRYRAGMPLHIVLAKSSTGEYARSNYSKGTARHDYQGQHNSDPKPHFRLSRVEALQDTLAEASQYMEDQGVSESGPIQCGRPDCSGQLRNLQALMRHLHIHNLHEKSKQRSRCGKCGERFNEQGEYYMAHICRPQRLHSRSRLNSLPACTSDITSPIKESFSKIINKIRP